MRAAIAEHVSPGGTPTPPGRPGRRALAGLRRYWQVIPVAVVLWAMTAVDQFRGGARSAGLHNAVAVDMVSRDIGGAFALPMNEWLAAHAGIAVLATLYYIVLHGLVTGVVGLLLIRRRVPSFSLHRNALIAATATGLVVFWVYPVAPPRMLPGYHDVAAHAVPLFSSVMESKAADQYAALPSLHVTWAIWVAVAAGALLAGRPVLRALVWLYPVLTFGDVLATANHYLLDALVAPGVVVLAYGAAWLTVRAGRRRRGRAGPGEKPDDKNAPDLTGAARDAA
jgi:hypothetical protein